MLLQQTDQLNLQPNFPQNRALADFWNDPLLAKGYDIFSTVERPDNFTAIITAHSAIAEHLIQNGLPCYVLDFGCFGGASTSRAYRDIVRIGQFEKKGALHFVGVDCVENFIDKARTNYLHQPLEFHYVPAESELPYKNHFSAATMFFVDQVIPNDETLFKSYVRIYNSLAPGGILTIVRLAEESFDPTKNFAFYGHNKNATINPNIEGPQKFRNKLKMSRRTDDGKLIYSQDEVTPRGNPATQKHELEFDDFYRNREDLSYMMQLAGFQAVNSYPLSKNLRIDPQDPNSDTIKTTYQWAYDQASTQYTEMRDGDDFDTPLFEVIIARK